MTRREREDLLKVARMRTRVAKADAVARAATLKAEFEEQMAATYSFDNDAAWKQAYADAEAAVAQATEIINQRMEARGIHRRFGPSLHLSWWSRGENAVAIRRAELRTLAYARIDEMVKQAHLEIDRASAQRQTNLLTAGMESEEAKAFLEAMPTAEQLTLDHGVMPYEFAKAVMFSLYDAHAAVQDAIKQLKDAQADPDGTVFNIQAAMMRGARGFPSSDISVQNAPLAILCSRKQPCNPHLETRDGWRRKMTASKRQLSFLLIHITPRS